VLVCALLQWQCGGEVARFGVWCNIVARAVQLCSEGGGKAKAQGRRRGRRTALLRLLQ